MVAPPPAADASRPVGIRRFLLKVGLFLAVQAASVCGLIVAGQDDDPYFAAYAQKRTLAETAPGPRVVLVGGSNLAFGVDSVRLGAAVRRTPVNLGLNAGLGRHFILDQAAASVKEGDLVILSLETGPGNQATVMNDLLLLEPTAARHLRLPGWKTVGDTALEYVMLKARGGARRLTLDSERERGYRGSGFDQNGDYVAHRTITPDPNRVLVGIAGATPPEKLEHVDAFARTVREAGATLAVVHPPVPRRRYLEHKANLDAWDRSLRERLPVPVLTTPGDAALPEELFYDTAYHLTGPGIERRTTALIDLLTAAGLAEPPTEPGAEQQR
ncbi:hypothetical protein [Alienimonas chondri]|uniref:SGNH hydrolase-type esterase domain-containing protein n=1 Tax=Alienimonas chondri TaxID=2681879 RepID=A0ABX1VB39_9PLAN|nr:hypothetical protein [Alienimonas chondri]NNJ24695.1 hypothetical protein [Alienimonas chondri]